MGWVAAHFRLFIGDLDPALSDDLFMQSFSGVRYPSFVKSRIIRDKYTNKGKGFGFVSYSDPEDFLKAWKEMNGTLQSSSSPHWTRTHP
jgi:RNA recognition motif-containing protein